MADNSFLDMPGYGPPEKVQNTKELGTLVDSPHHCQSEGKEDGTDVVGPEELPDMGRVHMDGRGSVDVEADKVRGSKDKGDGKHSRGSSQYSVRLARNASTPKGPRGKNDRKAGSATSSNDHSTDETAVTVDVPHVGDISKTKHVETNEVMPIVPEPTKAERRQSSESGRESPRTADEKDGVAAETVSIGMLSELSHPFQTMEALRPSPRIESLQNLSAPASSTNTPASSHAELSPISTLRSPFDLGPIPHQRTNNIIASGFPAPTPPPQRPLTLYPAHPTQFIPHPPSLSPPPDPFYRSSSASPPVMLAQPRPQIPHQRVPLLALDVQNSDPNFQSLAPPRLASQRRHSSAMLSPISDESPSYEGYVGGNAPTQGGRLVPVYQPELRRFSLVDGGDQVASARIVQGRRTSNHYPPQGANYPPPALMPAGGVDNRASIAFPAGPEGDLDFSLANFNGPFYPQSSRPFTRSQPQPYVPSAGNPDQHPPTFPNASQDNLPIPAARPRPRPNRLAAEQRPAARFSTFEEMGIQSYAMATKKGEKTVDSTKKMEELAKKMEKVRQREMEREARKARKKKGESTIGLGGLAIGKARPSSSSRPSSSVGMASISDIESRQSSRTRDGDSLRDDNSLPLDPPLEVTELGEQDVPLPLASIGRSDTQDSFAMNAMTSSSPDAIGTPASESTPAPDPVKTADVPERPQSAPSAPSSRKHLKKKKSSAKDKDDKGCIIM